jgi:hypothetical protein
MLALLIGSGAFPTSVDAASSTSAQADSKSGKASGKLMLARVRQTTLAQQSKLQAVVGASLADACTDSCAQTQADGIASCNASLVPAICAGEPACEAEIIFLRDSCIAEANAAYNACTAVSTLPDSGCILTKVQLYFRYCETPLAIVSSVTYTAKDRQCDK